MCNTDDNCWLNAWGVCDESLVGCEEQSTLEKLFVAALVKSTFVPSAFLVDIEEAPFEIPIEGQPHCRPSDISDDDTDVVPLTLKIIQVAYTNHLKITREFIKCSQTKLMIKQLTKTWIRGNNLYFCVEH